MSLNCGYRPAYTSRAIHEELRKYYPGRISLVNRTPLTSGAMLPRTLKDQEEEA